MFFDDEMPPEFYESVRKANFSNEAFLNILKWKDEFEDRCPDIAIYTPDQFAAHYYTFEVATKEVTNKDMMKGGAVFLLAMLILIANFTGEPYDFKWLIYVGCGIGLLWGGGFFITAANDTKPDMEAFFRQVKEAAETKIELDKRLGAKASHGFVPGHSSAFDVPPQE